MEPRLRSRGSSYPASGDWLEPRQAPFNGAAAAKPRKRYVVHLQFLRNGVATTFNGAAAAKPRKRRFVDGSSDERWGRPSMEPRLRSRGSMKLNVDGLTDMSTFNGAAAAKPRKLDTRQAAGVACVKLLQWSRGCEAAEAAMTIVARQPRCAAIPSMEPRLRSRGSDAVYLAETPATTRYQGLQWSRGCEAAEAGFFDIAITQRATCSTLQWSRGCEAAEA